MGGIMRKPGELKPLAKMIKVAVNELVFFSIMIVILWSVGIIFGFMLSCWWFLLLIPCAFFGYLVYKKENDLQDYLISI
jgi:hypothetical protein